ncbi:UNVERIFIED_CONTAM: Maz [Trichonephila clavipes]
MLILIYSAFNLDYVTKIILKIYAIKDWKFLEDSQKYLDESTCPVCKKRFFDAGTMRRHLKCHQTIRELFVCNFCNKSFTRKDNLNVHVKTIH